MPGVFLPAFRWVTWRIASSFADRERASSFCRFATRAPSPAFAARKIRSWMRRTLASVLAQSTSDHSVGSRPPVCSARTVQRLRSVLASSPIASAETRRKSAPFRAGYPPLSRALSPPLQQGLRFLWLSSTPSAVTLPRGRASTSRWDGWGLPCCPRGSCDRGGCVLSSGGSCCHRRQWRCLAIRPAYLFGPGRQPLGPVVCYGPSTDVRLRSAFRSPLGPTQIEAPRPQPIVPGARHVGSLLRTAG